MFETKTSAKVKRVTLLPNSAFDVFNKILQQMLDYWLKLIRLVAELMLKNFWRWTMYQTLSQYDKLPEDADHKFGSGGSKF